MLINMAGNFIANAAIKDKEMARMMMLDEDESAQIATAAAEVVRQYEIPVNEKTAAWIGLVGVAGAVYGSKIAAYKINRSLKN